MPDLTVADVRSMPTSNLRAELARALEITAHHLHHLAAVWRELENRGEDLSHLRSGLWSYMPLIAAGRLRAELVVQYAGHALLLRQLAGLVPEEQDRLLRDPVVTVVEMEGTEWVERQMPVTRLRATQLRQVLSGHIRSPLEQRRTAATRALGRSTASSGKRPPASDITPLDSIIRAAQQMPRQMPNRRHIPVNLTVPEIDALTARAAAAGVSPSTLIRAALQSLGVTSALE